MRRAGASVDQTFAYGVRARLDTHTQCQKLGGLDAHTLFLVKDGQTGFTSPPRTIFTVDVVPGTPTLSHHERLKNDPGWKPI